MNYEKLQLKIENSVSKVKNPTSNIISPDLISMKIMKLKNRENQPLHTKTVLKLIGNSYFTPINFKNAIKTVVFFKQSV